MTEAKNRGVRTYVACDGNAYSDTAIQGTYQNLNNGYLYSGVVVCAGKAMHAKFASMQSTYDPAGNNRSAVWVSTANFTGGGGYNKYNSTLSIYAGVGSGLGLRGGGARQPCARKAVSRAGARAVQQPA